MERLGGLVGKLDSEQARRWCIEQVEALHVPLFRRSLLHPQMPVTSPSASPALEKLEICVNDENHEEFAGSEDKEEGGIALYVTGSSAAASLLTSSFSWSSFDRIHNQKLRCCTSASASS